MTLRIEVNNVSVKFKNRYALKDITFTINENKIYGLLGRNGAGKTTLLSLLASFREPSSGSISIEGEDPFENAKLMQHVNFVFNKDYKDETDNLKNTLENVNRYRPYFDFDYANHLIQRFKLPMDKPLKQFSKGMQSAVSVTIGLASRAPITIFDEAYNGMDAPTREIFYQELLEDQSEHPRIIIMSTHLVSEMDYLFDEVLIVNIGELVLQEEYESLVTKGASITGPAEDVDSFVQSMNQLNTKQLGNTKSVMIYGELSDAERKAAQAKGLEVGPISLQELFIHLTEGEE
ncbi:ATP-binding cassette domain-containing protein [Ureibacillus chungkukjangi]|uniref:ATP-binding cassette domain-containing protein n=1 Tax=Ureibacillus chungkukjangi TaxID=1202712 RepID=UPI000D3A6CB5|nr:ABC transporter ATP-binding protein [Ureibacillus chungkukjangi]MCM3387173.1 ABC transporter ATP-binding protein [Ureibacillus chungkukjangi]